MTGSIFNIKKFAIHDGPGIRTTIFFSGCPLNCIWCHNPESLRKLPFKKCEVETASLEKKYTVSELMDIIKKDLVFYDESGGGVTFSGGEPLLQIEFIAEILELCRMNNISTAIDTSGYVPKEFFSRIYPKTDLFLYDLKLYDDELHQKYTGESNTIIFENLEYLNSLGCKLIIRIPLIPTITDMDSNLNSIAEYLIKKNIGDHLVELLPYNELAADKYRRLKIESILGNLRTQSPEKLQEIKNSIASYGLNVKLNH